jgi:prepilin-type N-terminal cleavage/methylation domain-containing protein
MQSKGFTLLEVVVAMGLLCVAALGGIQLVAVATQMIGNARVQSVASALASARMEQLRALRFEFDAGGLRVADVTTDLARDPPAGGGRGLSPSGAAALEGNVSGFVDFLDGNGTWLGPGASPPTGAVFLRRWSIDPLGASADLLVLQVLVRPLSSGSPAGAARTAGEVRLVTLRARTLR